MPSILDPGKPAAGDSPGFGDDEIRALKQFVADLFTLPVSPNQILAPIGVTNALGRFQFSQGLVYPDLLADPGVFGQLQQNNGRLVFNNGSAQTLAFTDDYVIVKDNGEPAAVNTAVETQLYADNIRGGTLGTNNFLHGTADFVVANMINAATLNFRMYYGGSIFLGQTITNGTGGDITDLPIRIDFRIRARHSPGAQMASSVINIGVFADTVNLGSTGVFTNTSIVALGVDSTISQGLQINVIWNTATPSNSVTGVGLDVWRV